MSENASRYSSDPMATSASMLGDVRGGSADGWWRLVQKYSSLIYQWAQQAGLQDADAADVVQDVLVSVYRTIGDFQHKPRSKAFRGWLWMITRRKIYDIYRTKAATPNAVGGAASYERMRNLPHEEPRGSHLAESTHDDDAGFLQGLGLIQREFSEQTWRAFWRTAVDEVPTIDVADELGMSVNAVRLAKHRVLKRLRISRHKTAKD